jgi:hypothetical protein
MDLCIDCKNHLKRNESISLGMFGTYDYPVHLCARTAKKDPVNGAFIRDGLLKCDAEREDALRLEQFRCGVSGKYYEAK